MPVAISAWNPAVLKDSWRESATTLKRSHTTANYTSGTPTNANQLKRSIVDSAGNIKQGLTNAADNALKASILR